MGDVIDLCDSDVEAEEDGEVEILVKDDAYSKSIKEKSTNFAYKTTFTPMTEASSQEDSARDDDIIEILDFDPPEDSKPPAVATPTTMESPYLKVIDESSTSRTTKTTNVLDRKGAIEAASRPYLDDESLSDDDSLEIVMSHPAVNTPTNPYARRTRAVGTFTTPSNPYKKASTTAVATAAAAAAPSRLYCDDDSDDDGCSVLHQGPVFARKAAAPSTVAQTEASIAHNTPTVARSPVRPLEASETNHLQASRSGESTLQDDDSPYSYPTLLSTSTTYQDVRAKFVLALWKVSRKLVHDSYNSAKLDQKVKKLVSVALMAHPVRSLEDLCFQGRHRVSNQDRHTRDALGQELEDVGWKDILAPSLGPSSKRKYYSIVEACLVAMLTEIERRVATKEPDLWALRQAKTDEEVSQVLRDKDLWISLESLIPATDSLLRPECPGRLSKRDHSDNGAAFYLESHTVSAEFKQLAVLERNLSLDGDDQRDTGQCTRRIKRHSRGSKVYFELTPLGYKTANMVRTRTFPEPPGHYRTSRFLAASQVPSKYQGICLGVDFREGGGGHKVGHEMCNKLDMIKVPYFVGTLDIGDYAFFTTRNERSYLCPILVERKSVEDVAQSIHDGRWNRQKRRMYYGQFVFGYDNSRIAFIIEGNDMKHAVTGGFISHRRFDVDMKQLGDEIENLKSEGFEVIRTPSRENTMFRLARWAAEVANDMRAGQLTARYTYAEFKDEVKKIPPQTDFSRLAKDAWATKQAKLAAAASMEESPGGLKRSENPDATSASNKTKRAKQEEETPCEYAGWSKSHLQSECAAYGLPKTGSRDELISKLKGPRPPALWLERKRKGQYVPPRHNVASTALLVALYLYENESKSDHGGITKDELYLKAEGLNITKNPFSGGTTQTGPHHYDGWSSMSTLLEGDPPLVLRKGGRYKLTRNSTIAGYPVAEQIHIWCHQHNNCNCGAKAPSFARVQSSTM